MQIFFMEIYREISMEIDVLILNGEFSMEVFQRVYKPLQI